MKAYLDILQDILDNGRQRGDRTGTGTLSIFDAKFKHDMRDGFPLLTTKRTFLRGVFWELMGFLRNDLHMQVLVDENVKIWDGFRVKEPVDVMLPYSFGQRMQTLMFKDGQFHRTLEPEDVEAHMDKLGIPRERKVDTLPAGALNAPYGAGWRAYQTGDGPVDQFAYAMDLLRNNPESRRILVSAWNPGWMPDESISPQDNVVKGKPCLTPCHWAFEFYTEEMTLEERWLTTKDRWNQQDVMEMMSSLSIEAEGSQEKFEQLQHAELDEHGIPRRYLSLKWHQRSCDIFLGVPFNIASYALLLMMVAREVGMEPYQLIGDLSNVHIYNNHMDQVKEQLTREPHPLPFVSFTRLPERIEDYKWEDVLVENYECHPAIKGDIAV